VPIIVIVDIVVAINLENDVTSSIRTQLFRKIAFCIRLNTKIHQQGSICEVESISILVCFCMLIELL